MSSATGHGVGILLEYGIYGSKGVETGGLCPFSGPTFFHSYTFFWDDLLNNKSPSGKSWIHTELVCQMKN